MTPLPETSVLLEQPAKVLVVDDHALVRDGVSGMLSREKDIRVVGDAVNADEAISKAHRAGQGGLAGAAARSDSRRDRVHPAAELEQDRISLSQADPILL